MNQYPAPLSIVYKNLKLALDNVKKYAEKRKRDIFICKVEYGSLGNCEYIFKERKELFSEFSKGLLYVQRYTPIEKHVGEKDKIEMINVGKLEKLNN